MDLLVNIDVDNLDEAIRFYASAFHLSVGRRFGDAGVEMMGGTSPIYLLVKPADHAISPASGQTRNYERHWTPVHLDFVVDDIEVAVGGAVTAGARLENPGPPPRWGKLAVVGDPFRPGFRFVPFGGRGYYGN